jgi:nucleoside recognition membrane protein YjiH
METLDGNALAGLLAEVFGEEMTGVMYTCRTCGVSAAIAETVVYPRLPGSVARCRNCTAMLMVITRIRGVYCVDMLGLDMGRTSTTKPWSDRWDPWANQ